MRRLLVSDFEYVHLIDLDAGPALVLQFRTAAHLKVDVGQQIARDACGQAVVNETLVANVECTVSVV